MKDVRCIDLYSVTTSGVSVSSFCFERSALSYAREVRLASFVVACKGRVLHWEGVADPHAVLRAA
jgi:hypothetical protein